MGQRFIDGHEPPTQVEVSEPPPGYFEKAAPRSISELTQDAPQRFPRKPPTPPQQPLGYDRPKGRLNDTELGLAATVAELIESERMDSVRNDKLIRVLLDYGPIIAEALIELRDVRQALKGTREALFRAAKASNQFNEPLASIHTDIEFVLDRVGFVLRD